MGVHGPVPISPAEFDRRFGFHAGNAVTIPRHERARAICAIAAKALGELVPPGREHATMVHKIEEAMFWANAGIARADGGELGRSEVPTARPGKISIPASLARSLDVDALRTAGVEVEVREGE